VLACGYVDVRTCGHAGVGTRVRARVGVRVCGCADRHAGRDICCVIVDVAAAVERGSCMEGGRGMQGVA